MSQMGSFEWFKEKLDRWATAYAVLVSVPIVGGWIKGWFDKFGEKAGQKIEKRLGQALGMDAADASKGFDDEILFREALCAEEVPVQEQVEKFRLWLREKDALEKTKKADAFVLGIAKAIKAFEKQIKKVHSSGGGKTGRPMDKTETSAVEYDHAWTKNFFARLIARATNEEKEKFVFVEENFQSLIPTEKPPLVTFEKIGEVVKKIDPELSKVAVRVTEINNRISGRTYEGFWKELRRK